MSAEPLTPEELDEYRRKVNPPGTNLSGDVHAAVSKLTLLRLLATIDSLSQELKAAREELESAESALSRVDAEMTEWHELHLADQAVVQRLLTWITAHHGAQMAAALTEPEETKDE